MIFGVDLIEAALVDEEVPVDGDGDNEGTVVEDLLLDVLRLRRHAIVSNLVFLTGLGALAAGLLGLL